MSNELLPSERWNIRGTDKLAELLAKKKGSHFLKIVKEPMAQPPPVEAPSLK